MSWRVYLFIWVTNSWQVVNFFIWSNTTRSPLQKKTGSSHSCHTSCSDPGPSCFHWQHNTFLSTSSHNTHTDSFHPTSSPVRPCKYVFYSSVSDMLGIWGLVFLLVYWMFQLSTIVSVPSLLSFNTCYRKRVWACFALWFIVLTIMCKWHPLSHFPQFLSFLPSSLFPLTSLQQKPLRVPLPKELN